MLILEPAQLQTGNQPVCVMPDCMGNGVEKQAADVPSFTKRMSSGSRGIFRPTHVKIRQPDPTFSGFLALPR
jgi:hypothetical protein